jgi:PadR family transcriptional regulator AphA
MPIDERESTRTCILRHMALRYAILGYLSSGPGSGYDLSAQLGSDLGWFWSASHSQIYPELKRLEEQKLVKGISTTVGEKLEKRMYTITDEGLSSLKEWTSDLPRYRPNRDPERLQLIFSDVGDIEDIRRHLEAHRERFRARAEKIRDTRNRILDRKLERVERRIENRPELGQLTLLLRDLAYGGDLDRAEHEVTWAIDALEQLDRYEASLAHATKS